MSFLSNAYILIAAGIAFAASFLIMLLVVGAANSAVEEEYWNEFWKNTSTTEVASDASALQASAEPQQLPKAA